jgi:hypothetical protein
MATMGMGLIGRGLVLAGLSLAFACSPFAIAAPNGPVGSANVTVADPTVPRPPGTPCVVQLYSNDTFDDYSPRPFLYAPPTACKGPWSKVVLEADFSVSAGRQFDRTANIWLGGVNLYFGTTQEPGSKLAPSWHVERDLTDYSALFGQAGQGQAVLGNTVNGTYTGIIYGSAQLLFYPVSNLATAAHVADAIYPLGSDPVGSTVALSTPTAQLSKTLALPLNIERAYLDVFAQSQNADEFWYTCVPNQFAAEVQECGGGNFREAEISIDGQPAGVAPINPWVYTGGIDPFLWEPTPGQQTLNFMPYRVDLTPFAGVLSNGAPHTVAVSVAGANNYFSTTASLLVYLDKNTRQVSGQVVLNTLPSESANPAIGNTLKSDGSGGLGGDITTNLSRNFLIEGYADTSHGRVRTQVQGAVSFADTQVFTINSTTYAQLTDQLTTASSSSTSSVDGNPGSLAGTAYSEHVSYPFRLNFVEKFAPDGSATLASAIHQGYQKLEQQGMGPMTLYSSSLNNTVDAADTLAFDASGNFTGHSGQNNTQTFTFHDSLGSCYDTNVASVGGVVTSYTSGKGCLNHQNNVYWYTHPDGSPANGSALPGW